LKREVFEIVLARAADLDEIFAHGCEFPIHGKVDTTPQSGKSKARVVAKMPSEL